MCHQENISIKCVPPQTPLLYMGYAGVYLFFLFLLQNIDCGYSLEPPRRGGSNVYPQSMLLAKIRKKNQKVSGENFHFYIQKISVYCMGVFS